MSGSAMDNYLELASLNDFKAITNIFRKSINHMRTLNIDQWDEIYPNEDIILTDIKKHQLYVYKINNVPISVVTLNQEQEEAYITVDWNFYDEKIAVIHRLCVDPDLQNQGIARSTMVAAQNELIKQGFLSIRLDAFSKNPYALKLYDKLGYLKCGEVTLRKGLFFCFEKRLSDSHPYA